MYCINIISIFLIVSYILGKKIKKKSYIGLFKKRANFENLIKQMLTDRNALQVRKSFEIYYFKVVQVALNMSTVCCATNIEMV